MDRPRMRGSKTGNGTERKCSYCPGRGVSLVATPPAGVVRGGRFAPLRIIASLRSLGWQAKGEKSSPGHAPQGSKVSAALTRYMVR